jgi:hypothetical protein
VEKRTRIIILNGAGSAGKGSIAKALQEIAARPFLHDEMDAFLAMLPEAYFSHPDGMIFETATRDGKPCVDIKTGVVAARLLRGMRRAVAALAAEGNDLIVDDVMLEDEVADYRLLLKDFDLSQALEDRRPGSPQRAPDQGRDGLSLPVPDRVPPRLPLPEARRRLLTAPAMPSAPRIAGRCCPPKIRLDPPISSPTANRATAPAATCPTASRIYPL